MKHIIITGIVSLALFAGWSAWSEKTTATVPKGKYLVILQAGKESHEGMARAVHALLYTRELKEHGHDVVLLFDGAGTEWADEFTNPDSTHKLTPMYRELNKLGVTEIICDFCTGAFKVKDALKSRKIELTGDYQGHPSIAKWADRGYQIIVL
jgi:hypothetical protein